MILSINVRSFFERAMFICADDRLERVDKISEVFKTEFGFHFIQLVARKSETVDVRHILVKVK